MREIPRNRILWDIPEEYRKDFATGLASYHAFADPEVDPDALEEFILFMLDENDGALTIQELWQLAELARTTKFNPVLDTFH